MKRGEVYWIENNGNSVGSEQSGRRPGLILQNDIGNYNGSTYIIAYLTTNDKRDYLPTHVKTNFGIVMLEHIMTVDNKRFRDKIGMLNNIEQLAINHALSVSVGLSISLSFNDILKERVGYLMNNIAQLDKEIETLISRQDTFKREYDNIHIVIELMKEKKTVEKIPEIEVIKTEKIEEKNIVATTEFNFINKDRPTSGEIADVIRSLLIKKKYVTIDDIKNVVDNNNIPNKTYSNALQVLKVKGEIIKVKKSIKEKGNICVWQKVSKGDHQ